tara:strand:- start:253 stop:516 length:264 start_codon:yes stop_codon:yes gene_type:complete
LNNLGRGFKMHNVKRIDEDKWIAILFVIVLIGLGIAGASDFEEEVAQDFRYCEMVAIWKSDAKQGIAPEDRNGWPPYNSRTDCGIYE